MSITITAGVAVGLLVVQILGVRPWLNRRTDRVLVGAPSTAVPRSRAHLAYVASEARKVVALITVAYGVLST